MVDTTRSPEEVPLLRLHAVVDASRGNGPGTRYVIWFQGCSLGCRNCCNPSARGPVPNLRLSPRELVDRIARRAGLEGVTLTGGEPLEQPEGLLAFLHHLREISSLSVVLFSGHTLGEIRRQTLGPRILALTDVLVDGRFDPTQYLGNGLRGSRNQQVHRLTSRYRQRDIAEIPPVELLIAPDGRVVQTGVAAGLAGRR